MIDKLTFGSVCSGIEASQLAFAPFGYEQLWSSEIAEFPSKVLDHHYPNIPNLGDMTELPDLILKGKVQAPDLFCGGIVNSEGEAKAMDIIGDAIKRNPVILQHKTIEKWNGQLPQVSSGNSVPFINLNLK